MSQGRVVSIHIAPDKAAPTVTMKEVRAIAGKGLEGDRYFRGTGYYSDRIGPHRQVTLIELESLEALERDFGVKLDPGESRRNIVTRDFPLSHMVGRQFSVGKVVMHGVRICEPCEHLVALTKKRVLGGLVHRAGLNASILEGGVIRVGDAVRELGK